MSAGMEASTSCTALPKSALAIEWCVMRPAAMPTKTARKLLVIWDSTMPLTLAGCILDWAMLSSMTSTWPRSPSCKLMTAAQKLASCKQALQSLAWLGVTRPDAMHVAVKMQLRDELCPHHCSQSLWAASQLGVTQGVIHRNSQVDQTVEVFHFSEDGSEAALALQLCQLMHELPVCLTARECVITYLCFALHK